MAKLFSHGLTTVRNYGNKYPKIRDYSTSSPNSLRNTYFLPCSFGQMAPCFHTTCYQGSLYIIPTWVLGLSSTTADHEPPGLGFPVWWQANCAANLHRTALAADLPWANLSTKRNSRQWWVMLSVHLSTSTGTAGLVCHCSSLFISGKMAFIIQTSWLSLDCLIYCLHPLTTAGWPALRTDNQQDNDAPGILFPEAIPSLHFSVPC